MASINIPQPLPYTKPQEMDDDELSLAVAQHLPPVIANIRSELSQLKSQRIVISFLVLGYGYETDGNTWQGAYFRSVIVLRSTLNRTLRAAERFDPSPADRAGFLVEYLDRLVPPDSEERRLSVIGVGLKEV